MLFLAQKERSDYRIVIPFETTPAVKTAAAELQKYIFDISRAYLDVVPDVVEPKEHEICVGYTNRDAGVCDCEIESLGDEGYIIKTCGERLFILGSSVRGALYGVYTFLEKFCDCRFYTNDFERVPKSDEIHVPDVMLKEVPVLEYRNVYWYAQSGEFISAKLKNNGWMGHRLSERVGGGIAYNGDFCHTLGYLAGLCKKGEAWWDNPCFTDEEVYKTTLENVKAELRAHPDQKIISVSQLDGNNGECDCENCRKLYEEQESHAANMLAFVNRIQEDIKDEFPDVKVDTLAYRFSRKPPKSLKAHPDVIVRLCNIECCFRHPLDECSRDEVNDEHFVTNLKNWSKLTNHLYIWDYTTNFTNSSIPFPNFRAMRKNVRLFVENGVTGIFEQGNIQSLNGEWGELRGYVLAKLLWNPYMTEYEYQRHIMDFMNDYYGRGGEKMKKLLDMEHDWSERAHFGVYFDDASLYIYDPYAQNHTDGGFVFFERAKKLLDEAELAAANDPKAVMNIRRSGCQLYNYKWFILRDKIDMLKKEIEDHEAEAAEANEERQAELKALVEEKQAKIAELDADMIENNKILFGIMRDTDQHCNREFSRVNFAKEPKSWRDTVIWW